MEIKSDYVQHIIIYAQKDWTHRKVLQYLREKLPVLSDIDLELQCADDDGDLDDDFPSPEMNCVIAELGLIHFYLVINGNDQQRNNIVKGIQSYPKELPITKEIEDKVGNDEHKLSSKGCKCAVL